MTEGEKEDPRRLREAQVWWERERLAPMCEANPERCEPFLTGSFEARATFPTGGEDDLDLSAAGGSDVFVLGLGEISSRGSR